MGSPTVYFTLADTSCAHVMEVGSKGAEYVYVKILVNSQPDRYDDAMFHGVSVVTGCSKSNTGGIGQYRA